MDAKEVQFYNAEQWHDFLLNTYFLWKFTQRNFYEANANRLREMNLNELKGIKDEIFTFDRNDIEL